MRTTWLPDVQARPRRIAIGEFDGSARADLAALSVVLRQIRTLVKTSSAA